MISIDIFDMVKQDINNVYSGQWLYYWENSISMAAKPSKHKMQRSTDITK